MHSQGKHAKIIKHWYGTVIYNYWGAYKLFGRASLTCSGYRLVGDRSQGGSTDENNIEVGFTIFITP